MDKSVYLKRIEKETLFPEWLPEINQEVELHGKWAGSEFYLKTSVKAIMAVNTEKGAICQLKVDYPGDKGFYLLYVDKKENYYCDSDFTLPVKVIIIGEL